MKYKVGDYVKVANDGLEFEKGTVVEIIDVDEHDTSMPYCVRGVVDSESYRYWFSESNLTDKEPPKAKYDVGDYVRIKTIHEGDPVVFGVVKVMEQYSNQLARITDVDYDTWKQTFIYHIDLDDGKWDWSDDMFEYRIGNYEDNHLVVTKYVIGYHYKDIPCEFVGKIENWNPSDKSCFVNESGNILLIPYEKIDFIFPIQE